MAVAKEKFKRGYGGNALQKTVSLTMYALVRQINTHVGELCG